jgi:MFS family permease
MGAFYILFQFLIQSSPSIMTSELKKTFSTNDIGISILTSAFFYTYIPLQIPAGYLLDRFKPKRVLALGYLCFAGAILLFTSSNTLISASTARILMGVTATPGVIGALYLAGDWFPPHRFALLVGITEMIGMLGGYIGQSGLTRAVVLVGWQHTFYGCAFISLLFALFSWLLIKDKGPFSQDPADSSIDIMPNQPSTLSMVKGVFANKQFWMLGLLTGCVFSVVSAFASLWAIPFLEATYHIARVKAALASSLIFLGTALGASVSGWISDFLERRRLPVQIGITLSLLLFCCILYIPHLNYLLLCILFMFIGITNSVYIIPYATTREISLRHEQTTSLGFINMFCLLIGGPILIPIIGLILHYTNAHLSSSIEVHYQIALTIIPITLLFSLILSFFSVETNCRPIQSRVDMQTEEDVIEFIEPNEEDLET